MARTDGRQDKINQVDFVENVKARIKRIRLLKNDIIVSLIIIKVNLILLL